MTRWLRDLLTGAHARPAWGGGAVPAPRDAYDVMLDAARLEAADEALEPLGLSVAELARRTPPVVNVNIVNRSDPAALNAVAKAAAEGFRQQGDA